MLVPLQVSADDDTGVAEVSDLLGVNRADFIDRGMGSDPLGVDSPSRWPTSRAAPNCTNGYRLSVRLTRKRPRLYPDPTTLSTFAASAPFRKSAKQCCNHA